MSAENKARTEVGIVKGKFGYMSPEQIRGEPMDRRSDVFATGICLYELLTSERLFSGDSDYAAVEKVRNVVIEPPSRLNREIPSALEAIVMKALAKHPRDRFQTAAELRRALLAFMSESRSECSAHELAEHMRAVFADDLRSAPTPEVLRREVAQRAGQPTGLAAFDNLDPISTISGASAVHVSPAARMATADTLWSPDRGGGPDGAPSVPPPVPRRDSVPAPGEATEVVARPNGAETSPFAVRGDAFSPAVGPASADGIGLDWDDDESRTHTERREPIDPFAADEALAADDEVTRQIQVGETFSGVAIAGVSGVRLTGAAPSAPPPPVDVQPTVQIGLQEAPDRNVARTYPPRRQMPQTSYALVIAIVIGIILVIAGALYATRDSRPASVHLSTAPPDARIRVDGKPLDQRESPFVIDDLAPAVPHRIEVYKDGYRGWSTRLALESGQVLRLPLVDLVPEIAPPMAAPPAQARPSRSPRPAATPRSSTAAQTEAKPSSPARGGSASTSRANRAQRRDSRPKPASEVSRARGGEAAAKSGTGVLRLNSRPWSEVSIDGKPAGNTPLMNHTLPAGAHTIRLVNPQFKLEKTIKVQIVAGKTLTKVVDLQ